MSLRTRIELSEYERLRAPASPPTVDDLRLASALGDGVDGARLQVRWLADGQVDITASAWIGVVRFSAVDVHVTPKYVGGGLGLLKLLDYTHKTRLVRQLANERTLNAAGSHLHELLSSLLADQASRLLRAGLLRNYRTESGELIVLRGRLDHRAQYLRRYGQLDRLHCTFDEYDTDNPENQFICAALGAAVAVVDEPHLRSSLLQLRAVYSEACHPPTQDPRWYLRNIVYSRLNERYRPAHTLARLVLEHTAFDDLYDTRGDLGIRSFLVNMNALFEEFVTVLFSDALRDSDLHVAPKERLRAAIVDASTARTYATIVPDLVLAVRAGSHGVERRTPVDIKYKMYADRKLSTSDIYQAFAYALALSTGGIDARAGLVYPGGQTAIATRLDINPHAAPTRARITAASLDVAGILDGIGFDGSLPEHMRTRLQAVARSITLGDVAPLSPSPSVPPLQTAIGQ